MLSREEYIKIREGYWKELCFDISCMHGHTIAEFDRSIYDNMSDAEISEEIRKYEESRNRGVIDPYPREESSSSWEDIRVGDWVYHRAEMGEETYSGWRHDPVRGMGW